MRQVAFIGFASGWGAQIRETERGPETLKNSGALPNFNSSWKWKETIYPRKGAQEIDLPAGSLTLPYIEELCKQTSLSVKKVLQDNQFPVVIGGDHTSAIGTWAGVTHHLMAKQKFGLIWIDAHMDAHTMDTTPSKAYHGMPLAVLLGFGDHSLVNILGNGPILSPQHICLIGIRSYEEGEATLLKRLGVRIYFMEEVEERGFKAVFNEALNHVNKGTEGFGLSIDLDAFDPKDAPGVGASEPHGLKAEEVLPILSMIQNHPTFIGLEIVEYNPAQDKERKTLLLIRDLLLNLLPTNRGTA